MEYIGIRTFGCDIIYDYSCSLSNVLKLRQPTSFQFTRNTWTQVQLRFQVHVVKAEWRMCFLFTHKHFSFPWHQGIVAVVPLQWNAIGSCVGDTAQTCSYGFKTIKNVRWHHPSQSFPNCMDFLREMNSEVVRVATEMRSSTSWWLCADI